MWRIETPRWIMPSATMICSLVSFTPVSPRRWSGPETAHYKRFVNPRCAKLGVPREAKWRVLLHAHLLTNIAAIHALTAWRLYNRGAVVEHRIAETRPARHRQDRRRRPGRQSPAVGHGCARLPAPARHPHHRSHRELAPGSARADPELDSSSPRQAHTPRPQDVRPAATLRARPRRVPSRASLHRAPQSSA